MTGLFSLAEVGLLREIHVLKLDMIIEFNYTAPPESFFLSEASWKDPKSIFVSWSKPGDKRG